MERSMLIAIGAVIISVVAITSAIVLKPTLAIGTGAVGADELANNSVTGDKIVDGTITDADIISTGISRIANNAVGSDQVADNSITSAKIRDEDIAAIDIATGAVTTDEILDETVGAADIADGAVTTSEILDGTIATTDIANGAVTYDKMAIKIKAGISEVVDGGTITHGLGVVPTAVVATPVNKPGWPDWIYNVNVTSVNATSFTVSFAGRPDPSAAGIAWQQITTPENVHWIAVYTP